MTSLGIKHLIECHCTLKLYEGKEDHFFKSGKVCEKQVNSSTIMRCHRYKSPSSCMSYAPKLVFTLAICYDDGDGVRQNPARNLRLDFDTSEVRRYRSAFYAGKRVSSFTGITRQPPERWSAGLSPPAAASPSESIIKNQIMQHK